MEPTGDTGPSGLVTGPTGVGGELVNTDSIALGVNVTTTLVQPLFTTLLTLPFVTVLANSIVEIRFTEANTCNGVARNGTTLRILFDGVPVGTATQFADSGAIINARIVVRVATTAGAHTIVGQFARFSASGVNRINLSGTNGILSNTILVAQEQRN